jgi:hypothetical protein
LRPRGVNYDVGILFGSGHSRPQFDARVARRELEIIRTDLHCNAVRISGTDIDRLALAADIASQQGLAVWLSPHLHDKPPGETLAYAVECARAAESLRQRQPNLVFILGCELTLFMQGILPGADFAGRIGAPSFVANLMTGAHNRILNEFLAEAASAVRRVFSGPVGYAAAPLIEAPDWSVFDFVGLDHYRDANTRDSYASQLASHSVHQKPVIVTEFGCCTYRGAEDAGGMGWAIVDLAASPPQIGPDYVRDEDAQANELAAVLGLIQAARADGYFVFTFVAPAQPHNDDPRFDYDMASYALVKSYAGGMGEAYRDMPWEPKESFKRIARLFAVEAAAA